jgi:colanic acid/amylovoran biosynthesis glycosyltransferase
MPERVELSVVIPTRDRWNLLAGTLDQLARQDLAGHAMEVVVVDNGWRDGTRARLAAAARERWPSLALRALAERKPGSAAARNAGIAAATGEVVLLLGDDCRPAHAGVVAGHLRAHKDAGGSPRAVVGSIRWDPAFERTEAMEWLERSGAMRDPAASPPVSGPGGLYAGNLSLPRRELLAVAGFDERFRGYGFEDLELGLRLSERGVQIDHRADLPVRHAHPYDLPESLARMQAVGRAANLLHRLHDHRRPRPGPAASAGRLLKGRLLAPAAWRPPPSALPAPVRRRWLDAAHLAAFTRGYLGPALPDDPAGRGYWAVPPPADAVRPAVSVIVPFRGTEGEARRALGMLGSLHTRPGDELLLVDNTADGVCPAAGAPGPRVVRAPEQRSSYYARNVGAESSSGDWLLFLDADCRPPPGLLDDLFRVPPAGNCGAVAGEVRGAEEQSPLAARYARARRHLNQAAHMRDRHRPFAITANLLVRRQAWAAAGGFPEHLRSGGDQDLCWALQEDGWAIAYREPAAVRHLHRERVPALLSQAARYGAAIAWMQRRRPGSSPRRPLTPRLARSVTGALGSAALGRMEGAAFAALDGAVSLADGVGYLGSNDAPARPPLAPGTGAPGVAVLVDRFPELSQTFVAAEAAALARLGLPVAVHATWRSRRPHGLGGRGLAVSFAEDDGVARRALALAWLVGRAPLACLWDLRERRRWAREEPVRPLRALAPAARRVARSRARHLHAHFADAAGLDAVRISRLLRLPYSVTAHAYDIHARPANLPEKLRQAAFATTGSRYNVEHLRQMAGPAAGRMHEVVMGVDPQRFRRRRPHPGGRHVVAVGRLVEKKGFAHLVKAAALLRRSFPLEQVTIAGDGPLHAALAALAHELDVGEVVRLAGPCQPAAVRELLEKADLVAAPCVLAADGDRDSMPVVVKEALAMEVPVVASDEVGLPEVVRPQWGRLVPPGDPHALAAAIAELLALPVQQRATMGRAGRAWVMAHCNVDLEAAALASLIERYSTGVR